MYNDINMRKADEIIHNDATNEEVICPGDPGIIDMMQKLYELLCDISNKTHRINVALWGDPPADLVTGEPDCLKSHMRMTLGMASMINGDLDRIYKNLGI